MLPFPPHLSDTLGDECNRNRKSGATKLDGNGDDQPSAIDENLYAKRCNVNCNHSNTENPRARGI